MIEALVVPAQPVAATQALLRDASERDRTTARRASLLGLLWKERFLTRQGLISRVEGELGRGCFGRTAWEDAFYRDMRVVRGALSEAGYQVAYSRRKQRPGYYLVGEPPLHPMIAQAVAGSLAEIDTAQLAIFRQLGPAGRFNLGCSVSDVARGAGAYRKAGRQTESAD